MNKITDRYRVFKPVSLSASQIGADSLSTSAFSLNVSPSFKLASESIKSCFQSN